MPATWRAGTLEETVEQRRAALAATLDRLGDLEIQGVRKNPASAPTIYAWRGARIQKQTAPSPASFTTESRRLVEPGKETVTELTPTERDTLKRLVACALQDRVSALKDLANESREQLYILFAKLSGELCEPCRSEDETSSRPWPEGRRVIKD